MSELRGRFLLINHLAKSDNIFHSDHFTFLGIRIT